MRSQRLRVSTKEEADQYGLRWGPLDVVRMLTYRGTHLLGVRTDYTEIEIYVSPTGRSIRVYQNGKRLS